MDLFSIRKEISPRSRIIMAAAAWVAVVGLWFAVTHLSTLPPFALPRPEGVLRALVHLWIEWDLLGNVGWSWLRIAEAFALSAVLAIPLGLLMASFRWVNHLVDPIAAPMRSMPITAFLPAITALFGIDEGQKVAFLWLGMFFYLLAVVVEEVNRVDDCLLETAYTLGASRRQALWLLFRASFPAVFTSFRILYDIGWTYVILAEMINARKGVGYMVEAARKNLQFDRVYAGIIAIGVAAFLFRWFLVFLEGRLFPWRRMARQAASRSPGGAAAAAAKAGAHGE